MVVVVVVVSTAWGGLGWSLIEARLEMEARKIEDWRSRGGP